MQVILYKKFYFAYKKSHTKEPCKFSYTTSSILYLTLTSFDTSFDTSFGGNQVYLSGIHIHKVNKQRL